jgi:hypothetical protein
LPAVSGAVTGPAIRYRCIKPKILSIRPRLLCSEGPCGIILAFNKRVSARLRANRDQAAANSWDTNEKARRRANGGTARESRLEVGSPKGSQASRHFDRRFAGPIPSANHLIQRRVELAVGCITATISIARQGPSAFGFSLAAPLPRVTVPACSRGSGPRGNYPSRMRDARAAGGLDVDFIGPTACISPADPSLILKELGAPATIQSPAPIFILVIRRLRMNLGSSGARDQRCPSKSSNDLPNCDKASSR